jgi:hypothetical protein
MGKIKTDIDSYFKIVFTYNRYRDWEGPVAGPCKQGNETSVSIKGGEFLD